MDEQITITPISIDDLDAVIALGEMLHNEEKAYEPLLTFNREASRAHYLNEVSNRDALILAAKLDDGKIIGYHYSFVHNLDYLAEDTKECVFEALFVTPNYRGNGIGKQLSAYAENWAIKDVGVHRIATHIYTSNTASVELHVKNGFTAYNVELVKIV